MEMLRNFLFEIAGCTSNFTVQNREQVCISEIREKVGSSKVLVSECLKNVTISPAIVKGKQSFNRLCVGVFVFIYLSVSKTSHEPSD